MTGVSRAVKAAAHAGPPPLAHLHLLPRARSVHVHATAWGREGRFSVEPRPLVMNQPLGMGPSGGPVDLQLEVYLPSDPAPTPKGAHRRRRRRRRRCASMHARLPPHPSPPCAPRPPYALRAPPSPPHPSVPPPVRPAGFPVALLSPGFLLNSSLYRSYAAHLASWGWVVALCDLVSDALLDDTLSAVRRVGGRGARLPAGVGGRGQREGSGSFVPRPTRPPPTLPPSLPLRDPLYNHPVPAGVPEAGDRGGRPRPAPRAAVRPPGSHAHRPLARRQDQRARERAGGEGDRRARGPACFELCSSGAGKRPPRRLHASDPAARLTPRP
jgi:hypothetical protein